MNRLLNILFFSSFFCTMGVYAQNVGVGTSSPDNSAKLDVSATDGGLLIPRMTEVQRDGIVTPATGLMIFQTDGTVGFYFYDGTAWTAIGSGSGTQGPAGPAGAQGPQGIQGQQGNTGATGAQGAPGAQGTQGIQGQIGNTGAPGAQGVQGTDGLSAYQVAVNNGFSGTESDWLNSLIGATGAPGATGTTGAQGLQGNQGATGAQGLQGIQGQQGNTGAQGVQGTDGLSAYQVAVNNGFSGTESDWLNSLIGATGAQGITGAQGLQGIQGAPGATGATGAQGLQGNQGATGAQGLQGIQGLQGATGAAGADGQDGDTYWGESGGYLNYSANPVEVNNDFYVNGNADVSGNLGLSDSELRLRGVSDGNHYLKYISGGGFDGPKLYGYGTVSLQTNTVEVVLRDGKVGVGTANPGYDFDVSGQGHFSGGLRVDGIYGTDVCPGGCGFSQYTQCCPAGGQSGFRDMGLWVNEGIRAKEFYTESDERIKDVIGISNANNDLNTIMQIEITEYTLKDKTKGHGVVRKVIAQQVEEVYPEAVGQSISIVPDIYQLASMNDGFIPLNTNVVKGDKVKLIFDDNTDVLTTVTGVVEDGFYVDLNRTGQVFVYGREVNDFRIVDYNALSMLNISATQALYQRLVDLEEANGQFQVQLDNIKAHIGLEEDNTASK